MVRIFIFIKYFKFEFNKYCCRWLLLLVFKIKVIRKGTFKNESYA